MLRGTVPALLLFAIVTAHAADGRTPVWQPVTITEPGAYYVARDITGSGVIVEIAASGVDLDLAGHTLTTDAGGTAIHAQGPYDVSIHDGVVVAGWIGIELQRVGNARLERVDVRGAPVLWGIVVGSASAAIVRDCRATTAPGSGTGLAVTGASPAIVARNVVVAPDATGLSMSGGGAARVEDNVARCTGFHECLFVDTEASLVTGNAATGEGPAAIWVAEYDRATANNAGGAVRCLETSVSTTMGDIVLEENVARNCDEGIQVGMQRVLLVGNLTASNADGLLFDAFAADDLLRLNVSRNNSSADLFCVGACTSAGDNFVPTLF